MSRAVVMFSSGAGSWAAARRYVDAHPADDVTLLFADTRTEDEDNYRFLREAAADIGRELVTVADGRDVWQVFRDQRMIGNTRISNCSRTLKQQPARAWLDANRSPDGTTVVLGIDWSESHRLPAVARAYAPYRVDAPLCEPPYMNRAEIFTDLAARGIRRPRLYDLGFAHANCGGFCVRAGQGQFAQLLKTMPARYAEHEAQEQSMRDMLGKDVSILRDRSRFAVLSHEGLRETDIDTIQLPTAQCVGCGDEESEHTAEGAGCDQFEREMQSVEIVAATGELLPSMVPLTLAALRERIERTPEQIDLFDLGGCGCFVAEDVTS